MLLIELFFKHNVNKLIHKKLDLIGLLIILAGEMKQSLNIPKFYFCKFNHLLISYCKEMDS